LRKKQPFFEISRVYDNVSENEGILEPDWFLYKFKVSEKSSPLYILDRKNVIHPDITELYMKKVDTFPDVNITVKSKNIMLDSINDKRVSTLSELIPLLYETDYALEYEDLNPYCVWDHKRNEFVVTKKWNEVVDKILQYNSEKDERFVLIEKAVLPAGIVMKYQPHTILVTPSNTGKSFYFDAVLLRVDRVTPKSFLGSARWKDDQAPGILNKRYIGIAIEQLESSQKEVEDVFSFLLSFLESGSGNVLSGNTNITVQGACPIVITGNPTTNLNNMTFFNQFLQRLSSTNAYALGKRMGIIAYGLYDPLVSYDIYDKDDHQACVKLFRAMEERAREYLTIIWKDPKIIRFCESQVYTKDDIEIAKSNLVGNANAFIVNHMKNGYPHLNGGAINCAIVDILPTITTYAMLSEPIPPSLIDEILKKAEEYRKRLVEINRESVQFMLKKEEGKTENDRTERESKTTSTL
jgi:hypothetical protein